MSWLANNLNISDSLSSLTNITGQISDFTREMLTEGTEEVADPSAELDIAKQQIKSLEIVIEKQKFEYEKLSKLNEELHERAEASDLQARHVARDYRAKLDQKEQEIMKLKEEIDSQKHDSSHALSWNRTRHDSTDSIDEHEEIKKLRNDIVKLQTECHHWKTLSSSQDSQDKLHREINQYQHELSTLQSTYSQKIANLNKKHKLEIQKWEEEKQNYLRKMEDLQHELKILEEVDNLEGMTSVSNSTGDDAAALKEELELAHDTITNLRKQLEKAAESFKLNESEFENMRKQLEERTSTLNETQEQLAEMEKKVEKSNKHNERSTDIEALHEQLAEREITLTSLSNEVNILKEELNEREAEVSSLKEKKNELESQESKLRSSLNEVRSELEMLSSSTLELMEELEYSQGNQEEQRLEIESLRKVCLVKGDAKDEIIHLKTIIGALWDRYVATLQLYQKVRHDLHSSNQRLLAQLKARHVMTPSNISALAERKQEELAFAACQLLLSLFADKERIAELKIDIANSQSIRQQVADVKAKLNDKNTKRREKVLQEKEEFIARSSELRTQIDEQESIVEDLRADNEQIVQETKELISEIGCQTANDSLDEGNDLVVSLQAEKAVLESTIVGLQNKVQELKEWFRLKEGKPVKLDSSDYYFSEEKGLDFSDSVTEAEVESMESIPLNEDHNSLRESSLVQKEVNPDQETFIEQLRQELEEYRSNVEDLEYIKSDLENDKSTLEQVVINLKTQIKELRENVKKVEEKSSMTTAEGIEKLQSLEEEKEKLMREKTDLLKSLRGFEEELVESGIISREDTSGFDDEIEKNDVLRLHLKEWVIRTRKALRESEERQANESVISISLDEKSVLEEEFQNAKKMIEELEGDNSMLREQTNDLIHQIEAKTTEVELVSAQLEEKCYEVRNFEKEKHEMITMINERDSKILDLQESYDSQMFDVSASKENDYHLLQDKLEEKKKECEKYRKSNEELMDSFQEKRKDYEDVVQKHEEVVQMLEEKKKECEKYQKTNEELMNTFEERQEEIEDVSLKQEDMEKLLEEKKKEWERYQKSNEELMNSFQEKQKEIEDLSLRQEEFEQLMEEKKKECEKYQKSNEELMNSFQEKQKEIQDLSLRQEEFEQLMEEKKKECEKYQQSNEELMNTFQEEHQAFESLGHEQEGIVQILEEKKKECEKYKHANEELMVSFQEKHQDFEDLSLQNTSLSEHVRESEILLRDLRQEKEKLIALLESKEQLVKSLSEESKSFAAEKEDLSVVVQEYQDKLHTKEKEVAEASHLYFEVDQLKRQARDSECSRKSIEERISCLSADNERLSTTLDEKNMTLGHLEAELKEKRSEVEHLDLEMDKLNELVGSSVAVRRDLEHQISSLKKKKDELESVLEEKDSAIDTLKLDLREKGAENDLIRLDVTRITKNLKEKEMLLQSGTQSPEQETQNQVTRMLRLIQEKEQEIEAMKQKEASLIAAVNQTDQTSHEALDHYIQQITHLTEETNRLMAEVERKDEELLNANDRLEVLQDKMSGKAQASVVLQSEHSRLLALNESQGNEIAKIRERNDHMVKLLEEKEKAKHNEISRLQDEFTQHVNELKREQERLLTLLSEKDRQIVALADAQVPASPTAQVYSSPPPLLEEVLHKSNSNITQAGVFRSNVELKDQQIAALEGQLSNSNRNLREELERNENLQKEINVLRQNVEKLTNNLSELKEKSSLLGSKDSRIEVLEAEVKTLNETLSSSRKELKMIEESHSNAKESILFELESLRIEKQELQETSSKEITELKNKLIKAFNSFGDCEFSLSEGFEDIDKNFNGIVQRIINQRNNVLREKDNEIRTLKTQIANLNVLTQTSGSKDYELEEILREKELLNETIMSLQNEKEDVLQEKESIVADLQGQIINLTKLVSDKDKSKNQDSERLIRERERMERELERIKIEKERNAAALSKQQSEFEKLTVENNRLSNLLAEEKSSAAKVHANSDQYKQVLQEKDNRINELSREKDELNKKSEALQQRVAILENDLSKACGGQKETEAKSSRELDRLREHLLQVEESYTKEALESEEREKSLRIRLAQAEEQLLSSSHSMQDRSRQASKQLESLQEQLHTFASQRDEAVMQQAAAQEQVQQYATSLDNLQMVLEQFQREKESQVSAVQEQAQQQINAARADVMQMQQRENELKFQLQNAANIVQELGRLKQELANKDEEIGQHRAFVAKLEEELRVSHNLIRDMNNTNDNKVDKMLLKNLLHGYFNTPENKRADVVHVIGGLLGFTPEEMIKIGTGSTPPSQGGWISNFLPFGGPPKSPTAKNIPNPTNKSFTELFVNFLQHESDAAGTPLPGRPGNTTNPLLTGLTAKPTPLSQPPTDRRQPLASSTPLPGKPPASSGVAMTTASAAPSPFATPVGISPITPMGAPRMTNNATPRPPMVNAFATRPPSSQPQLPTSGNPLLSMSPVQSLPSITSSGPSSLRNVLFQAGPPQSQAR